MGKVLVIGDLAWDIKAYLSGSIVPGKNLLAKRLSMTPGGVAGNIAWYIKELGHEAEVAGIVGDDLLGEPLVNDLKASGIGTGLIRIERGQTGTFIVVVDGTGERTMIGERGINRELKISRGIILGARPSWIHISGYSLMNRSGPSLLRETVAVAHELGVPLSVDLEGVSEKRKRMSLKGAYVFCNEGYCSESLREGARATIIKAGERGCYLEVLGTVEQFNAINVRPADLTGAGDAFDAAFISAVLYGLSEKEACRLANMVAGFKASKRGTRVNVPKSIRSLFSKSFNHIH